MYFGFCVCFCVFVHSTMYDLMCIIRVSSFEVHINFHIEKTLSSLLFDLDHELQVSRMQDGSDYSPSLHHDHHPKHPSNGVMYYDLDLLLEHWN